jgi:DtxR family Mn-dependent transcriptional regulator
MPKLAAPDLTTSVEDYLKAVYQLTEQGEAASTTALADLLSLAAPSVSGMIKRLAEQGLLSHEPYRGVTLTRAGRREALKVLRRHRLIESYLVEFLGYTWDTVHEEAERLEHAVSDDLISRMAEALGHPDADPHGDPIPSADGVVPVQETVPLPLIPAGRTAVITRVDTESGERLRWLANAGLVPGTRMRVVSHQPFDGPVTVSLGKQVQVVGRELASQLLCVVARTR